jgi:hypothetical protein
MVLTPGNGAAFQRRTQTGGGTANTGRAGLRAPFWVRLVRQGNLFIGSVSADGVNWQEVGRDTVAMGPAVLVGLVVTAHNIDSGNECAKNTTVFDHVRT